MSSPIFYDRRAIERQLHSQNGFSGQAPPGKEPPNLNTPLFERFEDRQRYVATGEEYLEISQQIEEKENFAAEQDALGIAPSRESVEELKALREQRSEFAEMLEKQYGELSPPGQDPDQSPSAGESAPDETLEQFDQRQKKEMQEQPMPSWENLRTNAQAEQSRNPPKNDR